MQLAGWSGEPEENGLEYRSDKWEETKAAAHTAPEFRGVAAAGDVE